MENQEFSASSAVSEERDTAAEQGGYSKSVQESLVHRILEADKLEECEELQEPESDQQDEFPEPDESRASQEPSGSQDYPESCRPDESQDYSESQEISAPQHSSEHNEALDLDLRAPFEPLAPSKPSCLPDEPRKPHRPHARSRRPPKTLEVQLQPGATAEVATSVMTSFSPRIPLASLSDSDPCEFVRKRFFSRKRIQDLSRPKKDWGVPDRKLFWGNQDPIVPVSRSALRAQLTKRLDNLAQPKEVSYRYVPNRAEYYYGCGRESVIWEIPSPALLSRPSKRIQELAQPNRFKINYKINRSLSNCLPKSSLQIADPSPRILRLSLAKEIDPNYVPPKNIDTKISFSTLNAIATPRTIDLAHPRIKIEGLCYEREKSERPIRPISRAALLAKPSPRTVTLAQAKPLHQDFLPARDPCWQVSPAALHSKVSPRVQELASGSRRTPVHIVYYDPEVFKVKPAALKAQCSPRILELAEPITR
ncbi:testicular haploid expressed gene protein-like isoform X1 [Talpa occidentalis]|uniref:testicular haploid expressed gene protein-like isoform X1 n=1 Tax=Talpa occidentalis TaxID=50954 RepID=UPI00188F604C|nr:testicular haploid expressed gene protein-like isoform X1 [Talpa occidentalis]